MLTATTTAGDCSLCHPRTRLTSTDWYYGGVVPDSECARISRLAREVALTSEQVDSPLARRPYDLRHAAASLWLNSGVSPTDVARRLGHGVAVLLRVYANCVDGQDGTMNGRIDDALGGVTDLRPLPVAVVV